MCGVSSAGVAAVLLLLAAVAAGRPSDQVDVAQNLVQGASDSVSEAAETSVPEPVNLQHPHAVLFGRTCGGTIISPTWVITAAHCTIFMSGNSVLAGTNYTRDGSGVTRRTKRLIVHPLFSVGPYWLDAGDFGIKQVAARWDFMLVELTEPLPLDGKTMVAATLDDNTSTIPGLDLGFGGFGASSHGDTMRHWMHGMEMTSLPDDTCQKKLPEYNHQDMICTQGRPPRYDTACNGDSGSGLVGNGTLYGVLSWVENDAHSCKNGALVIGSRIAAARDWIKQVTKI